MLDCLIRNGTVVDGTGRPRRRADVGVRDGKVVAIGEVGEPASRTVDADGLIVAPGFVDIHTHYDAQVTWDSGAQPSVLHGVTTIVGGNCGFSIAPTSGEHVDYLRRLLARVEGMPLESLEEGVDWGSWSSFGDYLNLLEGRLGVNAGFLAGHSAIRRLVMGADSVGGTTPTEDQLQAMERQLAMSIEAGALGLSSSNGRAHNDGNGDPIPSRWAGDEELSRLSAVVGRYPGTVLEYIPAVPAQEAERMTAMSLAADRALNWNLLTVVADRVEMIERDLGASDYARQRGARIVALTVPAVVPFRYNFISGFGLDTIPNWGEFFLLPMAQRVAAASDPTWRQRLREGADLARRDSRHTELVGFDWYRVEQTYNPDLSGLQGRQLSDIAAERATTSLDVLFDILAADDLRTIVVPRVRGDDDASWAARPRYWRDPRVVLGGSDAGAHLDLLASFTYFTNMLAEAVRRRGLMGLEEAIHLMVDRPARLYGLSDRGRVAEGWQADLVLFDEERVAPGPVETRNDLPAGAPRLYASAVGIERVFVNGEEVVVDGKYNGARPGKVLRSGRDTVTQSLAAGG